MAVKAVGFPGAELVVLAHCDAGVTQAAMRVDAGENCQNQSNKPSTQAKIRQTSHED